MKMRVDLPMLDAPPSMSSGRPGATGTPRVGRVCRRRGRAAALPRLDAGLPDERTPTRRRWRARCWRPAAPRRHGLESADLIVINSCAIREAAEHKVIGRMGALGAPQGGAPRRSASCSRAAPCVPTRGRPAAPLPGRRPLPATRPGARADGAPRPGGADRPGGAAGAPIIARVGRSVAATADRLPGTRRRGRGGGDHPATRRRPRLAAHHLRLRQDVHVLHRALQLAVRSAAAPSTTSSPRRVRSPTAGVLDVTLLGPERQLLRSRPARRTRASATCRRSARLGRRPAARRPPGHGRPAACHRRPPRRRRRAAPSPACAS